MLNTFRGRPSSIIQPSLSPARPLHTAAYSLETPLPRVSSFLLPRILVQLRDHARRALGYCL